MQIVALYVKIYSRNTNHDEFLDRLTDSCMLQNSTYDYG